MTNQPPDAEHLAPMLELVREHFGELPEKVSADCGYLSEDNLAYAARHGLDAYIAVPKKETEDVLGRLPITDKREGRLAMRQKLSTPEGNAIYARRKAIVEPVFGQIKEARRFRRFSLRSIAKARAEWSIVSLCHNLLKLFRAPRLAAATA